MFDIAFGVDMEIFFITNFQFHYPIFSIFLQGGNTLARIIPLRLPVFNWEWFSFAIYLLSTHVMFVTPVASLNALQERLLFQNDNTLLNNFTFVCDDSVVTLFVVSVFIIYTGVLPLRYIGRVCTPIFYCSFITCLCIVLIVCLTNGYITVMIYHCYLYLLFLVCQLLRKNCI